ncbi:putative u3 small nucleolar ribonucleoprotein mpp10 [Phaeomoniella chlamydospora]|uniref:U3 small nucleolar ribonucleoprotein protein MPP10 n=1 Tax=Phaeomoniella chlamydospora TaxID=158046 RepID=A0A0G2F1I0_PHACM|nr:putative u3 small nucleolar ribonucleoprotein mpp10 [Phaeomoniella chlamydospora]
MAAAVSSLPQGDAVSLPSQDVLSALSTSPQAFLQPTSALHTAAILAAKRFLDPLAARVSESQEHRRQELRRKRKRSTYEDEEQQVLQLKQVYTDGFGIDQIWEQAKRILDAAQVEVSRGLQRVQESKGNSTKSAQKAVRFDENLDGMSEMDEDDGPSEEELDEDLNEVMDDTEDFQDELDDDADDGLEDPALSEDSIGEEDIEMSDEDDEEESEQVASDTYVKDPHGLNDGFFSIDDFNRQSQFLEQQDERGDPDDGAASDEEIDWSLNPLSGGDQTIRRAANGDGDDESEEDGPTFGDVDLDAESDEADEIDEEDIEGDMGMENANDITYADFFDPPQRKPSKTKRMRALPKTQPPKPTGEELDADIQRAVSDVRRDLFDDEPSEVSDSDEEVARASANLSTHEKQRAKLMAEIRRLETAAVAKRDWTLSGEARAVDRPVNSLIEEDLEFERTGKPVPVITNEVSEEIEQLIKRRILAREFDEVIRRRPELSGRQDVRRGRVEVDDSKPQQGLAEVYETEHLRATDPNYADKLDEKTKREHAEISSLWKNICGKLDLLSNWNYKPKIPEAHVTVVADAPTISMEDARPSAAAGIAGSAQNILAPQEVYAPGRDVESSKGEIFLKGGAAISKEEMSREEKLRRRRREKERSKKRGENVRAKDAASVAANPGGKPLKKSKGEENRGILEDLRKGGVKVIGKRGEVTNVDGKTDKANGLVSSASAFKL